MIGVIGGMGVYAGTDLVDKISSATIASSDQDHLPVVLLSYPDQIPDRSLFALGDATGTNPGDVVDRYVEQLVALGCTVCGIACNTFHVPSIFGRLTDRPGLTIVHLVEETARQLGQSRDEVGTVCVLGTQGTMRLGLYDRALRENGLPVVKLSEDGMNVVSRAIRAVPGGLKVQALDPSHEAVDAVVTAVDQAIDLGADSAILGCTELPFVLRSAHGRSQLRDRNISIVDPASLLARALVRAVRPDRLAAGGWRIDL